jgi:hypothetical protein
MREDHWSRQIWGNPACGRSAGNVVVVVFVGARWTWVAGVTGDRASDAAGTMVPRQRRRPVSGRWQGQRRRAADGPGR